MGTERKIYSCIEDYLANFQNAYLFSEGIEAPGSVRIGRRSILSDIEKCNDLDKEFATFWDKLDQPTTRLPNSIRFTEPGKQMNHNNQNAQTPTIQSAIIFRSRRVKRQNDARNAALVMIFFVFLMFYVPTYYIAKSNHWKNPGVLALAVGILGPLAFIVLVVILVYLDQCSNHPHQHHLHQQAQPRIELPLGEPQGQIAVTIPSDDLCAICLGELSLSNVSVYLFGAMSLHA